jgi:hypothetical protein
MGSTACIFSYQANEQHRNTLKSLGRSSTGESLPAPVPPPLDIVDDMFHWVGRVSPSPFQTPGKRHLTLQEQCIGQNHSSDICSCVRQSTGWRTWGTCCSSSRCTATRMSHSGTGWASLTSCSLMHACAASGAWITDIFRATATLNNRLGELDPNYHLGAWASRQRRRKATGKLSHERLDALESLNFSWEFQTRMLNDWMERLSALLLYRCSSLSPCLNATIGWSKSPHSHGKF